MDQVWELHGKKMKSDTWRYLYLKIRERFKGKAIGSITPVDIETYCNEVTERTSPSTSNRYLTLLKSFFRYASKKGLFYGIDPSASVSKRTEPPPRDRWLTKEEIQRIWSTAHPRLRPVLACALLTGMRRGEILSLRWEQVDFVNSIIYLPTTKSGEPKHFQVGRKLLMLLKTLGPEPTGSVFNLPLISFRKYFKQAVQKAEIKNFRFHDSRHTAGSWNAKINKNILEANRMLGHSSIQTTMRYIHFDQKDVKRNLAAFEKAIPISPRVGTQLALGLTAKSVKKRVSIVKSTKSPTTRESASHAF